MVHYRLPVTGIDIPIQALQREMHDELRAAWMLTDTDYQCYGRAYKLPTKGGIKPEVYKGDSNYHEVLLDDKCAVQSFFSVGDKVTVNGAYNEVPVSIKFFVHLGGTSALPMRADEEARAEAQKILGESLHGFTLTGVTIGGAAVSEFATNALKGFDMHPYHVFSMDGILRYQKPTY